MTNLKIGIGLSFYEDFDSLRRMLQSCQSYPIDLIIAVDGKYKGYPAKNWNSSDKCYDLFDSFQTPFHRIAGPPSTLSQNEKRQIYFDVCKEDNIDCLIVMDSDEYFIHEKTNWPLFIEDLEQKIKDNAHTFKQAYCIPTVLVDKGIQKMPEGYTENLPRLFHRPSEVQYVDDHFSIRNKKTGVLMTFEGNSVLQHIAIGHDHSLRTKQHNKSTQAYEENLILEENASREQKRDDFIQTLRSS